MKQSLKHRVRDIGICILQYSGCAFLYRLFRQKPHVRIVVFHDTPDPLWFESMIQTLIAQYHVITPEAFVHKEYKKGRVNVLITFDDGYASWDSVAVPILEKYNLKALFFINSGLIDVSDDAPASALYMKERLHLSPKAPLTWDGVRLLCTKGHTIGGHTRSHAHLGLVTAKNILHEIATDKEIIEQKIGVHLTDFAYPFGTREHVTCDAVHAVQNVGYARAYTAVSRFVRTPDSYEIPRMCIERNMTPKQLNLWMCGAYDLFDILKSLCVR